MGALQDDGRIRLLSLDCIDTTSEAACGRLLWEGLTDRPFVAGSQGVEYALVRHWIETGVLIPQNAPAPVGRQRTLTGSGAVSPTTALQIAWSRANGFVAIPFDTVQACGDTAALERGIGLAVAAALAAVDAGADPLIHTAEGPDDPAVDRFRAAVGASGRIIAEVNERIGTALGRVLSAVLVRSGLRRAIISGGRHIGPRDAAAWHSRPVRAGPDHSRRRAVPGPCRRPDGRPATGTEGRADGQPELFGSIRDGGGAR